MNNPVLDEAMRLHSIGLSVLPIGRNKKPAVRVWKPFQTMSADNRQIHDWFDGRDDLGLAIVLGRVSQHLVARDFDEPGSYDSWAEANTPLSRFLPTVQASRGPHVYARILDCPHLKFVDGELRSTKNYIVVPPSVHPSGCQYRWERRLDSLDDVPILSLDESGFDRTWIDPSEPRHLEPKAKKGKATDRTDPTESRSVRSVLSVLSVQELTELIEQTLPPCFGVRRHRLFLLARRIRSDPCLKEIPLGELKPIVQLWHQFALPTIRTKSFDESWADFVEAFENVDPSRCVDAVVEAMRSAASNELPSEAFQYESPIVQSLVGLCAVLSRNSTDGVFFLSCRKGAEAIGATDHTLVARMLKMLVADGVLLVIEPGGPLTNKASRYRYLGHGDERTH